MFLVGPSWLLKLSRKAWNPKNIKKQHVFFKVFGGAVLALEALLKGLKSQKP